MEILIKSGDPTKQRAGTLVLPIFEGKKLHPVVQNVDKVSKGYITTILKRGDISGKLDESLLLHNVPDILADRVLLIGCGKERELDWRKYTKIIKREINELDKLGGNDAVSYLTELNVKGKDLAWNVFRAAHTTLEARYDFQDFKSKRDKTKKPLKRITFIVGSRKDLAASEQAVKNAVAIAEGMTLTKDLGNTPPNVCTPTYLSKQAEKLARGEEKLTVTVLGEKEIADLKMGAFLSVADGAKNRPKFIIMEYKGARKDQKPVVLVGKGVTFDTGGNSLKPGASMAGMKYDMLGAGTVLGVFKAVLQLGLKINLIGLIPTTENRCDGASTRPDDVITAMDGTTIEVLNTDAEGRLILCDALTYAHRYNPEVVIDMATLTGACVIALGRHATALVSNHNALANDLLAAGLEVDDRAWQMPYWDEYYEQLKSKAADMANIGGPEGGTLTAAAFLGHFTKKLNWAHLDIAGSAAVEITGANRWATGRPVPLLVNYLINRQK